MRDAAAVVAEMRELGRRGAHGTAAAIADALPPGMRSRPPIALERARARMRQGRMIEAQAAVAEVDLAVASAAERLLLALESASLSIFRDVEIAEALRATEAAYAAASDAALDPVERAEAERVRCRIFVTAAIYHEIDAEAARLTLASLPELADRLEAAGRLDEGLAARLTYAQQLEDRAARLEALAEFAALATRKQRPELAGEAVVLRANLLLANGAPSGFIRAELDGAIALFAAVGHVHGPIDARCVLARLAIERERGSCSELEACVVAYDRLDYPRGALSALMDLAQLAHVRGDTAAAYQYRQRSLAVAGAAGMGLALDGIQLAQVDLLLRNGAYGEAIELCQASLARGLPAFRAASFEQLLSSAYSLVGDHTAALAHGRCALDAFVSVGAVDSASDAAMKLASDLGSMGRDAAWDEAEALLERWRRRDEQRGDVDAAVSKLELVAQFAIQRFVSSPARRGDPNMLATAEEALAEGNRLAMRLPPQESALRRGSLYQLRGQLRQLADDLPGVEQAWRNALEIYEHAGLAMQAANCRYILGAIALNHANRSFEPYAAEAERLLSEALAYYVQAGMRTQAASARHLLSRLYANAAAGMPEPAARSLLEDALVLLGEGEADFDAVRREYAVGSAIDTQRGKRALAEQSRKIYELALEILALPLFEPADFWRWAQRAKARGLTDALGAGTVLPRRTIEALEAHPESLALAMQDQDLAHAIGSASADRLPALRQQQEALRERMARDPQLTEYLELRTGSAVEQDDLPTMLGTDGSSGPACHCVDWVTTGERIFLIAIRPADPPRLVPLGLPLSRVRSFVADNLGPESFRSTLRDSPELLRELDPLIAPLADLCAPDELLVLSPTGPLNALPLHALDLGGVPLLERNPVAYCPSLGVLRHCLARRAVIGPARTAALFGDPTGDRGEAADLVASLARYFGSTPFVRDAVTRAAFAGAIADRDVVHFQGHAKHVPDDPLASYLNLADGPLTARDVFDLRDVRAELVTLAACESAASVVATGDEPLGLIPAFLYAGAGAVVATLWRVHRSAADRVMRHFYDAMISGNRGAPSIDKARALQAAMLQLRRTNGFEAPYWWAPFILHGDWR